MESNEKQPAGVTVNYAALAALTVLVVLGLIYQFGFRYEYQTAMSESLVVFGSIG